MTHAKTPHAHNVALPAPRMSGTTSIEEALERRRSVREYAAAGLALADLSQLLWATQGVTSRGGGRTAPSAGALYPLEVYVLAGHVDGLEAGVYHHLPVPHELERNVGGDRRRALASAAPGQEWIADAAALVVIAAVFERTTGKYAERGERYVHLDVAHAAENLLLQAAALGYGTCVVAAFDEERVRMTLGLPASEEPIEIIPVGRPR